MKGRKRIREVFERTKRISRKEREMMKEEKDKFVWKKENGEITEWVKRNEMKEMTGRNQRDIQRRNGD